MKILLTVHQFLPDFSAGTEVLTFETAKELRRLGHSVHVFTGYPAREARRDQERFDHYEVEGIPVERFQAGVPMGGQENTTEAEYNNQFFASYFRQFLKRKDFDIVHFFHLGRLSASAVDVCCEYSVPTVLTPTDFWFVCPTTQLRLPNGSMCAGPAPDGVNCFRHVVALNRSAALRAGVAAIPDWLLALALRSIDKGYLRRGKLVNRLRALYRRPGFLRERLDRIDSVLVPTRLMERILKANGLAAHKIVFCPYGINLSHIQLGHIRTRSGLLGSKLRLGFIGTLGEHKGVHVLIRAMQAAPELPLELKIHGNQNEFPEYVRQIKGLAASDERIQFCGTFPNREIWQVFAELDCLVVPSIWYENAPLVIYSAQAAGCPVIASNLDGMAEAVHHNLNGLLFESGDVEGLASLLRGLCSEPSVLAQLSAKAIRPKSCAQYAAEVEAVYQQLLSLKYAG